MNPTPRWRSMHFLNGLLQHALASLDTHQPETKRAQRSNIKLCHWLEQSRHDPHKNTKVHQLSPKGEARKSRDSPDERLNNLQE